MELRPAAVDDAVAAAADGRSPPLLVMLYAPWCGHCKKMHPTLDRIAGLSAPHAVVARADASSAAFNRQVKSLPSLRGFPTLLLVRKGSTGADGDAVVPYRGPRSYGDLVMFLEEEGGVKAPLRESLTWFEYMLGRAVRSGIAVYDGAERVLGYKRGEGGMGLMLAAAGLFSVVLGGIMFVTFASFMYLFCERDDPRREAAKAEAKAAVRGTASSTTSSKAKTAAAVLRTAKAPGGGPPPPPPPPPAAQGAGGGSQRDSSLRSRKPQGDRTHATEQSGQAGKAGAEKSKPE